jgi:YVTN family beta-propeller protein
MASAPGTGLADNAATSAAVPDNAAQYQAAPDNAAARSPERFVREGIVVDFSYDPADPKKSGGKAMEGEFVDLRFKVTEEARGNPVRSLRPGAWMDMSVPYDTRPGQMERPDCRKKVSLYLQGIVGIRPMLDLNGYYIVLMNKEPNLYVIDPFVGMAGRTNILTSIRLKEPGTDWVKNADEKRLYVTLAKAGKVAAVETETFKLVSEVDAGENPVRAALQPDGGVLWVGNDAPEGKEGGVTAIDPAALKKIATVPTGKGHHELAFSADSRYAYATNRADGTVTVIDARKREKVRQIEVGGTPISLGYSALSRSLYVADGNTGTVSVVDGEKNEVVGKVQAKPGLGPMRVTPDGRWVLVLNSTENAVHILDASTNRLAHTVAVGEKPYQVALTRGFAHVRCLGTERVFMVNLDQLGKGETPGVQSYAAGSEPPKDSPDLGIASGIASVTGQSEVLIVNPVSNTTFFYQDGMNFPSGNYPGYQQRPRAVETINRSLRETEPGVYTARARAPVAGVFDVALFMDSPKFVHCFSLTAVPNPDLRKAETAYEVEYLLKDAKVPAGEPLPFRFRLKNVLTGWPVAGLKDARLMYYLGPGRYRTEAPAREVEEGVYEATLNIREPGAYSVFLGVPSLKIGYTTLLQKSLLAEAKGKGK